MDDIEKVLEVYDDHPLRDGDVALLTDLEVVQEIEGLADEWDAELRRNIAYVLTEVGASELTVAVARRHKRLLPQDHALWADLREELLGSPIVVHPLRALPAA